MEDNISNSVSFEQAFDLLEEKVKFLEEGGIPLEESVGLFEEGMRLLKICNEYLNTAELKISTLKSEYEEQMKLVNENNGAFGEN